MKTPNYEMAANCIAVIAKEYDLDDKATQSLARIVRATVDTYAPEALTDNK